MQGHQRNTEGCSHMHHASIDAHQEARLRQYLRGFLEAYAGLVRHSVAQTRPDLRNQCVVRRSIFRRTGQHYVHSTTAEIVDEPQPVFQRPLFELAQPSPRPKMKHHLILDERRDPFGIRKNGGLFASIPNRRTSER